MATRVFKRVFGELRYALGGVVVVFIAVSASLLLSSFSLMTQILSTSALSWSDKLVFIGSLYGTLFSSNTVFSGIILIITSLLFGVNIGLLVYYIRRRQEGASKSKKVHLVGIGGMISAVLGIGCAACGSVILTTLFGVFGAGSMVLFLPFDGAEFGVLGIILLLISILYLIKHINDPLVCPVE